MIARKLDLPPMPGPCDCHPAGDRCPSEIACYQPESILHEADRLVSGERNDDYGHPLDDFGKVSGMALALWGRGPETPEEHAIYMVFVKLAREANRPKRDNLVDAAGYLKTLDMIHAERARRST